MKVLLDACVSPQAKTELEVHGHDVIWAGGWSEDPGDAVILEHAYSEQRALVTLDKDFGELGVLRAAQHCGMVRLVNFRARHQGLACVEILENHGHELREAAIITAEPGRRAAAAVEEPQGRKTDPALRFHSYFTNPGFKTPFGSNFFLAATTATHLSP